MEYSIQVSRKKRIRCGNIQAIAKVMVNGKVIEERKIVVACNPKMIKKLGSRGKGIARIIDTDKKFFNKIPSSYIEKAIQKCIIPNNGQNFLGANNTPISINIDGRKVFAVILATEGDTSGIPPKRKINTELGYNSNGNSRTY